MLLEYEIMVQHHDSAQNQSFYCLLDWDDMNFIWIQMEYNTSAKIFLHYFQTEIHFCMSVCLASLLQAAWKFHILPTYR